MNKIAQINCHVLFKQMHTMLWICTLENMRSRGTWKALCSKVPSVFGIRTRDQVIRSWDRSEAKSEAYYILTRGSYDNAQNVPCMKTEQFSKYIFNTYPLAFFSSSSFFFMKFEKKSLARFDPGTSRLLDVFYHCTVLQVEVFRL